MPSLGHSPQHYAAIGMNLFFFMGDNEGWVLVQGPWFDYFMRRFRCKRSAVVPVFRMQPRGTRTLVKLQDVIFEKVRWTEKLGSRKQLVYGWRLLDGVLPDEDVSSQLSAAIEAPQED